MVKKKNSQKQWLLTHYHAVDVTLYWTIAQSNHSRSTFEGFWWTEFSIFRLISIRLKLIFFLCAGWMTKSIPANYYCISKMSWQQPVWILFQWINSLYSNIGKYTVHIAHGRNEKKRNQQEIHYFAFWVLHANRLKAITVIVCFSATQQSLTIIFWWHSMNTSMKFHHILGGLSLNLCVLILLRKQSMRKYSNLISETVKEFPSPVLHGAFMFQKISVQRRLFSSWTKSPFHMLF